jgi:hypothetical protein
MATNEPSTPPPPPEAPAQPEKLPFPLQDGERIIYICRKHWVFLWPNIILKLLAAILLPILLAWLLDAAGGFKGVLANIYWILAAIYIVYWAVRIFLAWYRYRHDIWVITNQRLIDSYKSNPFNLRISSADLVNLQDISVLRSGFLQTTLDYGDVVCQTASDTNKFVIGGIPVPREVQALLDRERDRERTRIR